MSGRNKRALPEDEALQSRTKKERQAKPFTSRINCTHVLEMFKVKKALTNLLKIDSSVVITTSRIGSMWRARCKFHDLNCTQDDESESSAKEKVAGSIIHELILRRDPLLDRLPTCYGIMNLPRDEYIQGLIWNVYGDLDKVQIEKRNTASAGGIGSQMKYAKIYVNNIAHESMLPRQDNARRSVFCAAFSTLAGVIAPPREADPAFAPPIPTRVSPQRAIALLKKLKPAAVFSYVPRFAAKEESSREFIKTWKATVKLDGKAYHATTAEKMSSLEQAALLALSALRIVDDPEPLDAESRQQHIPPNLDQVDVSTQSKENCDASSGRFTTEMREETSIERNVRDGAREDRPRNLKKDSKKIRDSSSDSSFSNRSSSSGSSGSSRGRSLSSSSSSTDSSSSSSECSSASSRPPGTDKKRPRKRASSVDSQMRRIEQHRRDRSSRQDVLEESLHSGNYLTGFDQLKSGSTSRNSRTTKGQESDQNRDFVNHPPTQLPAWKGQHLKPPQQQPIGPVTIPPPIWGQMATVAPMHSPVYYSQNCGVPMNHPLYDSFGRQALNVRFPYTSNPFQYSAPPPTMNYPAMGSVQYDYSYQQNLMGCDTSIPPPPPNMWPLHYQQQQRYQQLSQPLQQQRPFGFTTGSRFMPPFQPELGNFNRPPPTVPLAPASDPGGFLASPNVMVLRPHPPPSGCPAPRKSDDDCR